MSFALLTFDANSTVRMEIDNRPDDDFIAGALRDERRRSWKTLTEANDIKSAVLNVQKLIADEGASNMHHSHEMLPSPQRELLETASHLHAPRLPHMSSIHVWSPFPPESLHEEVGFGPESYEASLWASSAPNLSTGSSPGENAPQDAPQSAPQLATQADQNPMFLSYYTASIHPNVTKVSLGNSLSAALGSTVSVPSSSIPTAMGLPTATSYAMLTYTPVLGFDLDHYPALSSTFNFGIDLHGIATHYGLNVPPHGGNRPSTLHPTQLSRELDVVRDYR
ncbi:hypothetical protein WOLCODRAFT_160896 [Wolfiporia cocos MD-104 SS10]|uniref:Uncharacterized protein n=1 Tax=Wolfiporia cocos (strain MD-104) TaxID=742152 RepID=A0A2H3IXM7_WOLCO|nr:hypothetical protein WOLCODRAFT_160896 [Wolfiporia cocos MD-104 SS10]